MKKAKKILVMVAALALTAALAIGGTLAYLTSTDKVENTFTVGKVAITLDEADVKVDGTLEGTVDENRVKANEYHLLPGHSYIKDPIIHVDAKSENCWLFVKLENQLVDIIDATTIEDQMKANGAWTLIDATNNIYAYKDIVSAGSNVATFTNFTIKGSVDEKGLESYAGKTIVVTAYAVQADGFTTAEAAWTASFGAPQG